MKLNKIIPLSNELFAKLVFLVLILMIVAIPFSRFLMSVSQFAFAAIWLAHGRFKEKLLAFKNNPTAIIITSIYLFHLIGMLWTEDINYGLKDLRIKLPLFILPFMFVGFPQITNKQFKTLIYFFVASVLFVSIYLSIAFYASAVDIKQMLHHYFISHIRYSLSLNLAIFFLLMQRIKCKERGWKDILAILVIVWLVWFLFFLKAFTGVIVFVILIFVFLSYFAVHSSRFYKKAIYFGVIILGFASIGFYLFYFAKAYHQIESVNLNQLDERTASGRLYMHEPELGIENGKYIYIYVCNDELKEAWNKRSHIDYDSVDLLGQRLKYTLIRYLTSKDLRKDKEGVQALSQSDISNIEKGIANVNYTQGIGVESRLMKIMFEYDNYVRTGDPSGHSVMQRVEYWKTAWSIIQKHFWFGVGTGDLNMAFDKEYDIQDSKLSDKARLRSHNQYLSIWIAFGIVGFIWFIFAIFYSVFINYGFRNIYFTLFFITFIISMITEDTIETQAGVTFFVFFSSLFLLLLNNKENTNNNILSE